MRAKKGKGLCGLRTSEERAIRKIVNDYGNYAVLKVLEKIAEEDRDNHGYQPVHERIFDFLNGIAEKYYRRAIIR